MESIFYVGQQIVCIKEDKNEPPLLTKGKIYQVLSIKQLPCCRRFVIQVYKDNNSDKFDYNVCRCGKKLPYNGIDYYSEDLFAPIQDIGNMTFDEAIKLVTPKTNKNEKVNLLDSINNAIILW